VSNSIRTACFRCTTPLKSTSGKTGPSAKAPSQRLDRCRAASATYACAAER
jgi:hypothetical protein